MKFVVIEQSPDLGNAYVSYVSARGVGDAIEKYSGNCIILTEEDYNNLC